MTTSIQPIPVDMEIHDHPNKWFMAKYPRYEPVILDHTAMIAAKRCLRYYFYRIVLGRAPREDAPYFAWGSAYHKYREMLEKGYGINGDKPKLFDESKAQESYVLAAQAGLDYWKKHGRDQELGSKFEFMTTERLLKSFMKAYDYWAREKKQGKIEVIAIEQTFNVELPDGSHRSGRADQIVRWNGKLWGRDFKTTSKDTAFYERSIDPNEQFTGYTYAEGKLCGEPIQGQIIELLFNGKPTKSDPKGPEIVEKVASRTPYQLAAWEREHIFYKGIIDKARETDIWPMQEVTCPFCPFHSVCKQGSEAGMMYQLESQYTVKPWDNTKVGDMIDV